MDDHLAALPYKAHIGYSGHGSCSGLGRLDSLGGLCSVKKVFKETQENYLSRDSLKGKVT